MLMLTFSAAWSQLPLTTTTLCWPYKVCVTCNNQIKMTTFPSHHSLPHLSSNPSLSTMARWSKPLKITIIQRLLSPFLRRRTISPSLLMACLETLQPLISEMRSPINTITKIDSLRVLKKRASSSQAPSK